jgi:hypothetical protein
MEFGVQSFSSVGPDRKFAEQYWTGPCSGPSVEIGFARAFLPHEFASFGISMDESRAR